MKTIFNRTAIATLAGVASAALVAAAPVSAHADPVAQPAPVAAAVDATANPAPKTKEPRYCVVDQITGSRIPQKECHTKAEWQALGVDITHK